MPVYPKFISKKELQKIIQNNYIGFERIITLDKQDFFKGGEIYDGLLL